MSFLRNRLLRRLSIVSRLGDIVLVGGLAVRVAQRKGWISEDQMGQMGLTGVSDSQPIGVAEMVLAGAAVFRLLRRKKSRR